MPYVVLALAGLAGLLLLMRVIAHMPPAQLLRGVVIGGALVGIGTIVFLVAVGREALAFGLAGLAIPVVRRWRHYLWGAAPAAQAGQSSDVSTSWLAMRLDHASGQIGGTVLKGVHAGRLLADLSLGELLALWRGVVTEDPPSARLLEAYLDRVHEGWRGEAAEPSSSAGPMDQAEALRILGLEGEPDEAAIRAAHHRLMMANHPDRGGSAYIAAKINQARDRLLGGHSG